MTAIEAIQKSNGLFLESAKSGHPVLNKTKDLMLCLSGSISSLQFSSYNAIIQGNKDSENMPTPTFSQTESTRLKRVSEGAINSEENDYLD